MHKLLESQDELYGKATKLLEEVLFPLLEPRGGVNVGGSYLYELMYHPDVDLDVVVPDLSKEIYIDLCKEILALDSVSKFTTTDRVLHKNIFNQDHPKGYWLSPKIEYNGVTWLVDIWMISPGEKNTQTDGYKDKLSEITEGQRIAILELKKKLIEEGRYGVGKDFNSADVYDVVLEYPESPLLELLTHLNKKR